jgi:phage shock protein PspC (stress-responsive transcriptional regulator)
MTEAPSREPAAPPSTLRRSAEGRFLFGVCAGLGRHTGIDPVVFRVAFAVLMFGSGIGFFLYVAAFLLMKEPSGKPGMIEQWTRRDFAADTVLALLTAVLALGLGINLTTVWLDTGTLVVGLLLAISLLAAHASGVDLLGLVRSMPERLNRRPQPDNLTESSSPPQEVGEAPAAGTAKQAAAPHGRAASAAEAAWREAAARHGVQQEAAAAPERDERKAAGRDPDARRVLEDDAPFAPTAAHPVPAAMPETAAPAPDETTELTAGKWPAEEGRASAAPPRPRTAAHAAYGEPFAPHGPYRPSGEQQRHGDYQPLDPARRGGYSPYDPALYSRPEPVRRQRRPKSYIGAITMALATIVGGIVVAVQAASPSGVHPTLVCGAVLVTIGAGLLIAAWWGRGAGLVAAGTMVTMLIGVGLMFGGLPSKVGESVWHPRSVADAGRVYDAGVGEGRLDLSELRLDPGARVTFDASITVGELTVIVPPTARVEVHAANRFGDIKVDQSLRGGMDVEFDKVLEPEVAPKGKEPTIVLNLRGGFGDLEVRRAA